MLKPNQVSMVFILGLGLGYNEFPFVISTGVVFYGGPRAKTFEPDTGPSLFPKAKIAGSRPALWLSWGLSPTYSPRNIC